MDRLPTELLYVIIFLGIVAFQFVARRLQRRAEQAQQAEAPPAAAAEEPLEDIWGRTLAAPSAPVPAVVLHALPPAPAAEARAPRRLHPVRALLDGKRNLRRAVVLTMVLGPCRAQEPPDRF